MSSRSIPNPLRILGAARILAGAWFIATGIAALRQYGDLMPQAQRLLASDIGATDAPIRALLTLLTAPVLVVIGLVLVAKGLAWMRRALPPREGPTTIARDEVVALLRRRQLLAYADGPAAPYWPLRRWLSDELARTTWWRREIISRGIRAFVRSSVLVLMIVACCLALPFVVTNDLLGPFPAGFVIVLPVVTTIWAVLALLMIAPHRPRIESVEFSVLAHARAGRAVPAERIIETPPRMLNGEPPGLGITLGVTGVAVQCLMLWWWNLSYIGYPLLATSIIRDSGSIGGGILFFVLGNRMVTTAAELLLHVQYDSILVLIDAANDGIVVRAAGARTESHGLGGPRHVIAAVGGSYVRESAERLIEAPIL